MRIIITNRQRNRQLRVRANYYARQVFVLLTTTLSLIFRNYYVYILVNNHSNIMLFVWLQQLWD